MQEETFNHLAYYNIVYLPLFEDFKKQLTALLPIGITVVLSRTNMLFPDMNAINAQSIVILTNTSEIDAIPYGMPCDISDGYINLVGKTGKVLKVYHFGDDKIKSLAAGITKTGWYFYDEETEEYEALTAELLLWIIGRLEI